MELIFSDVTWAEVKRQILWRKTKSVFRFIGRELLRPIFWLGRLISRAFYNIYTKLSPKKDKIRKISKLVILIYVLLIAVVNVILYFSIKKISIELILSAVLMIPAYFLIKLLLRFYHYFIGDYQLKEQGLLYTRIFITQFMFKLLKIFGRTGAGKDTFMAGASITLSEHFYEKTLQDMEEIKEICYIFDFEKLDQELLRNNKLFLSFSKEIIEHNFVGDSEEPGLAIYHNLFLKKYYIKSKKITPEFIVSDYYNFMEDPVAYETEYATGVGVGRKHYLQIILEEYIQWFIRINIEKNFIIANQPLMENLEEGIMAREFSFNFLKTKKIKSKKSIMDPKTKKRKMLYEKVFFPWKDRLILMETECGTWWSNKDGEIGSELTETGIRDFKAYQRQFMQDFYWFQVDQASDRTQKLFRELDHGYAYILNRNEIEGGKKKNLFLNFLLNRYQKKIDKMKRKCNKKEYKKASRCQKFEDLQRLYVASSKDKYKKKLDKLDKKYAKKDFKPKYYIYQKKVSNLRNQIKRNKKDGYIVLDICMSPAGTVTNDYKAMALKDILAMDSIPSTFVGKFVFKTRDCERYDTRYLRNLAEAKAKESEILFSQIKRWNKNFKMTKDDVKWMAYNAGNDMYGITEEEVNEMKYFDGYKNQFEQIE